MDTPAIARATAYAQIGPYLSAATIDVLPQELSDDDPVVRAAAVAALESVPAEIRVRLAFPMLDDPVRAVRIEAPRVLASIPAYVNLADLYRAQGREAEAENVLCRAAKVSPGNADVHHALGLSLVRQQRSDEGIEELRLASTSAPDNARYVYVYAIALNSTAKPEQAIMVLQGAHNQRPNNRDILSGLVAFRRGMGNEAAARRYADKLHAISP